MMEDRELNNKDHLQDDDHQQYQQLLIKTKPTTINNLDVSLSIDFNNKQLPTINFDNDNDFSCGIFRWHPKYLQRFANKQCFLALFCLTCVLQGIYSTYFVSVLTTIEKLYQIQSRTAGIIMSSTEIGQITGALLLTYYGGQGHRPRWIATGMFVFAFAALLCSTPHYLFGSQPVYQRELSTSSPSSSSLSSDLTSSLCTPNSTMNRFCNQESEIVVHRSRITNSVLGIFFMSLLMIGLGNTAVNTLGIPYIDDNVAPKESPLYFGITIGVRILGPVCGFLLGSICTSIPVQFPFGTSDLNPNDPNWIGAWWLGLFLVGASLSLAAIPMMVFPRRLPKPDPSSYCHQQQQQEKLNKLMNDNHNNHHHHNHNNHNNHSKGLNSNNELNNSELVTFCDNNSSNINNSENNFLHQQQLQQLQNKNNNNKNNNNNIKINNNKMKKMKSLSGDGGFFHALKRLFTNDILLCRTASSVLHILPIAGLYTFLPKYLESQFQLTATYANIIAGLGGILVMGIGVLASGTFMRKYNPSARFVAKWIAFAALSYVLGMTMLMFLGCPNNQFAGFKNHDGINGIDYFVSANNEKLECSADCQCSSRFDPICMNDGTTYMSPCLAGCTAVQNGTNEKYYVDCRCSRNNNNNQTNPEELNIVAKPGICPLQCNTLTLYIIIFSVTVLIHSTSEVGAMLLTLRCVEPRDKARALGFISFATSLFGNVPCPIIYGTLVDSTCLFWEEDCGKRGACRLYDSKRFRQLFHGITAFIMFMAFCIDLIVCYKASAIQFNDEDTTTDNPNDTTPTTKTKHDKNENQVYELEKIQQQQDSIN